MAVFKFDERMKILNIMKKVEKRSPPKENKVLVKQCIKAIQQSFGQLKIEAISLALNGVDDQLQHGCLLITLRDETLKLAIRTDVKLPIPAYEGINRSSAPEVNISLPTGAVVPLANDSIADLLVFEHIDIQKAKKLQQQGIPFADRAGNLHLPFPRSLIYVVGQPDSRTPSTSQPVGAISLNARLCFGLLARPDFLALTQRELAQKIGVALGGVSSGLKQLIARGYVSAPQPKRTQTLLRKDQLLDVWRSEYEHRLAPRLRRRRMSGDIDALRALDVTTFGMQWGGEVAAERITKYLRPVRYQLYADPKRTNAFAQLAAAAKLRKDESGNIEIIDRFWHFDPVDGDRTDTVPLPLVYADLMASGDPRCQETAAMIRERFLA